MKLALFRCALVLPFAGTTVASLAQKPAASPASRGAPPSSPAAAQAAPGKGAPLNFTKQDAVRILKVAEEIRSPDKAELQVSLANVADGRKVTYELKILRSTERRAFVDFLAPDEEHGRRMLARGDAFWSTFPDSKRVVPISRKEMIGNSAFAIADIFGLDADKDYDPEIVGREQRNGSSILRLDCKAKHDEAPYPRIEYWVEEKGSFPVQAKFYTASGKLVKSLTVESRAKLAGRIRPEQLKMVDEVTLGKSSVWKTKSMNAADVPDNAFVKENLLLKR